MPAVIVNRRPPPMLPLNGESTAEYLARSDAAHKALVNRSDNWRMRGFEGAGTIHRRGPPDEGEICTVPGCSSPVMDLILSAATDPEYATLRKRDIPLNYHLRRYYKCRRNHLAFYYDLAPEEANRPIPEPRRHAKIQIGPYTAWKAPTHYFRAHPPDDDEQCGQMYCIKGILKNELTIQDVAEWKALSAPELAINGQVGLVYHKCPDNHLAFIRTDRPPAIPPSPPSPVLRSLTEIARRGRHTTVVLPRSPPPSHRIAPNGGIRKRRAYKKRAPKPYDGPVLDMRPV